MEFQFTYKTAAALTTVKDNQGNDTLIFTGEYTQVHNSPLYPDKYNTAPKTAALEPVPEYADKQIIEYILDAEQSDELQNFGTWQIIPDYRGETAYAENGTSVEIDYVGDLKQGYQLEIPISLLQSQKKAQIESSMFEQINKGIDITIETAVWKCQCRESDIANLRRTYDRFDNTAYTETVFRDRENANSNMQEADFVFIYETILQYDEEIKKKYWSYIDQIKDAVNQAEIDAVSPDWQVNILDVEIPD